MCLGVCACVYLCEIGLHVINVILHVKSGTFIYLRQIAGRLASHILNTFSQSKTSSRNSCNTNITLLKMLPIYFNATKNIETISSHKNRALKVSFFHSRHFCLYLIVKFDIFLHIID